jgi:hypothetical protein
MGFCLDQVSSVIQRPFFQAVHASKDIFNRTIGGLQGFWFSRGGLGLCATGFAMSEDQSCSPTRIHLLWNLVLVVLLHGSYSTRMHWDDW